jgi:hypothetical protein
VGQAQRYAIYKLRHKTSKDHFRLLEDIEDPVKGVETMLYRVEYDFDVETVNMSVLGGILYNTGEAQTVRVMGSYRNSTNESFQRVYELLETIDMGAGQFREVAYLVPKEYECALRVVPDGNRVYDMSGVLTYANRQGARNVSVSVDLYDTVGKKTVGSYKTDVGFEEGEVKSVRYVFKGVSNYGNYILGLDRVGGLDIVYEKSTEPLPEEVIPIQVFC